MALARLGNVEINLVESEQPQFQNDVTEKPVESGQNIADHVKNLPDTLILTATISGPDWQTRRDKLLKYRKEGTALWYRGKVSMLPVVIQSLYENHDRYIKEGYRFTATLRQIRIAVQQTEILQKPDPAPTGATAAGTAGVTAQTAKTPPRVNKQLQEAGQQIEAAMVPPIRDIYGPSILTLASSVSVVRQRQDALNRLPGGR